MPNIDYNSQSKNYTKLNKRLAGYIKEIQLIFQQLNHEGCKIALDLTDISDNLDKVLDFSKYPQTKDRLNKLMAKYQKGISSVVVSGMNAEYKKGEIDQDTLANNLIERCNNKLPDSAPRLSKKTSTIITSSTDKAKDSFLNRANRGFNLKSKLALQSKEYIKELESAISVAIGKGTDAKTLSKQVTNLFLDYDKLDKEYKLKFGEPIPSKNIQYQAMRLARSEINMAYRDAEQARWRDMPFVLGYEIVLSNNHNCKGVPKGHFYDICDELAGKYPKDFKWLGWHPNCYHKDTKILTNNGWKLFDDVEDNDLILSLNPNTKQTEWVGFTARQKYFYKGDMIRFYNRSLDCIVTPEHSMVYLDAIGNVCRKNASEFTHHDGSFILDSNTHCISKHFLKEINYYSDYVYDLTLEKNHIFYVSLHGKCFWGSNCRCHAVPIMMTDEQFIKWNNGKQVNAPTIDKMPKKFDKWLEQNKDRIERATQRGTLPYFLMDNTKYTNHSTFYRGLNGIKLGRSATKGAYKVYKDLPAPVLSNTIQKNIYLVSQKIGVKLGKPMTFFQANKGRSNIDYKKGFEFDNNCQSTAVVHEARIRGLDVTALGYIDDKNEKNIFYVLGEHFEKAWISPNTNEAPTPTKVKPNKFDVMLHDVDKITKPIGRYHIGINMSNDLGHIITAERLPNGSLLFYDAQIGEFCNLKDYSNKKVIDFEVLKVDNLLINENVFKLISRAL